jgi:uncharacterized membrane protein
MDAEPLPLSERVARPIAAFIGTGKFLTIQTLVIIAWCGLNAVAWAGRWDPYPWILLNLAFSTQAAYAAPLILLAANRQAQADRLRADHDHVASDENLQLTRAIHATLTNTTETP